MTLENIVYKGSILFQGKTVELYNIDIFESSISFTIDGQNIGQKGSITFNGELTKSQIIGTTKNLGNESLPFQADIKISTVGKELGSSRVA